MREARRTNSPTGMAFGVISVIVLMALPALAEAQSADEEYESAAEADEEVSSVVVRVGPGAHHYRRSPKGSHEAGVFPGVELGADFRQHPRASLAFRVRGLGTSGDSLIQTMFGPQLELPAGPVFLVGAPEVGLSSMSPAFGIRAGVEHRFDHGLIVGVDIGAFASFRATSRRGAFLLGYTF